MTKKDNGILETLILAGTVWFIITKIPGLKNCTSDLKNEAGKATDFAAKQYEEFKKFLQLGKDNESINNAKTTSIVERCPADIRKNKQRKMFY